MKTKYHFCQDVQGALRNWSPALWRSIAKDNGVSVRHLKLRFRQYLDDGIEVIPIHKRCEGFDDKKGCPGHEVTIPEPIIIPTELA